MRILAIILNVLLLGAIAFTMVVEKSWIEPQYIPVFLLLLAAPIVSVVALLRRGAGRAERKALEEGPRVESLRDAGAQ